MSSYNLQTKYSAYGGVVPHQYVPHHSIASMEAPSAASIIKRTTGSLITSHFPSAC